MSENVLRSDEFDNFSFQFRLTIAGVIWNEQIINIA